MTSNSMLAIIPTRGRPENIARFNKALKDTNAQLDLVIGIDDDDIKKDEYIDFALNNNIIFEVGPRVRFGKTLNNIAIKYANNYKYISWFGDDHLPRTYEWDRLYREELDRLQTGIVYGNDLVQGPNIPTQMAMTSDIVKILGRAVPDGFIHLFIDNYFLELGRGIDKITYLPNVIVQHLHPCASTAVEDDTYREANQPAHWTNDRARFDKYVLEELHIDVKKIKESMK